jgi:FdhE protein
MATVLTEVLAVIYREPVSESFPALDPDRVRDCAARNIPILREMSFELDDAVFQRRWLGIAEVLENQKDESAPSLIEAARAGRIRSGEWLRDVLECRPGRLLERSGELGLVPSMASVVFRWSVFPVLCKFRNLAAPFLASAQWERGYCPVCGSSPILGEIRGLEQDCHLRCGWCASDWRFARVACTHCETRDHHHLQAFHVEGKENRERVNCCDACRGYLKTVFALDPLNEADLLVRDLATVHLDLLAAERAYGVTTLERGDSD